MIKNIFFTDLFPGSTYMITLQIKHNFIVISIENWVLLVCNQFENESFLDLSKIVNNRYLIMKMLTLSSCPDWSPFSADISVCFVVDDGHIDMKFHPSRGYDRPLL